MLKVTKVFLSIVTLYSLTASMAEAGELSCKIDSVVQKNGVIKRDAAYPSVALGRYELQSYKFPIVGTNFTFSVETDFSEPEIIKEFPDLIGYTGKVERTLNKIFIADENGNGDNFVFVTNNPDYYCTKNLSLTYQFKTPDGYEWMFVTCTID